MLILALLAGCASGVVSSASCPELTYEFQTLDTIGAPEEHLCSVTGFLTNLVTGDEVTVSSDRPWIEKETFRFDEEDALTFNWTYVARPGTQGFIRFEVDRPWCDDDPPIVGASWSVDADAGRSLNRPLVPVDACAWLAEVYWLSADDAGY